MPERFQLRRTKGWRMPTGAVKVDRSTPFGNPYDHRVYGRAESILRFERLIYGDPRRYRLDDGTKGEYPADALLLTALAGRPQGCWCRLDQLCHADVLLAYVEALAEGYDEDPEDLA